MVSCPAGGDNCRLWPGSLNENSGKQSSARQKCPALAQCALVAEIETRGRLVEDDEMRLLR